MDKSVVGVMTERVAGLLICGTSHTGKATLAGNIAQALSCDVIATDTLARHPGRPWPTVRPEVADFYANLSNETIQWFLQAHHENMQCLVHRAVAAARVRQKVFVLEGCALRPELYAPLVTALGIGVCLHAEPEFLRARIMDSSDHARRDPVHRRLIDVFIDRSLRENTALCDEARSNGFEVVEVDQATDAIGLAAGFVGRLRPAL